MYQVSLPLEASVVDESYLMMKTLLEMGACCEVICASQQRNALATMMELQGYHPEHVL